MCKRDKEDREKRLSCLLDVEPLSELSPDNGRPRVFKSVAAFICEQASANVATRRGLGDPTTSFFFSLSLSLSPPPPPPSFLFPLLASFVFFYYYLEVLTSYSRSRQREVPKKEARGWGGGKGGRYKIHVVTWRGQQGTKRLTSLEGGRNPICDVSIARFLLTSFFSLPFIKTH